MTFPAAPARRLTGREVLDRLGFALRHGAWQALARVPEGHRAASAPLHPAPRSHRPRRTEEAS
ncbi:hypothetical protein [Kitasatospora sp. NPDC059571]|uniref:hypothetical protein n=1 Tax=Kitasatospora sp. NPDC059571 TaxID=3346871 RepID=UPI0036BE85A2